MHAEIDYTTMRLGTVTRRVNGKPVCKIARCPACGRKGEYHPSHTYRGDTNVRQTFPAVYDHKAHFIGWAIVVDDSCFVREDCTDAIMDAWLDAEEPR